MNKVSAEKFALENDLELDEVINLFRGVDKDPEDDLE